MFNTVIMHKTRTFLPEKTTATVVTKRTFGYGLFFGKRGWVRTTVVIASKDYLSCLSAKTGVFWSLYYGMPDQRRV